MSGDERESPLLEKSPLSLFAGGQEAGQKASEERLIKSEGEAVRTLVADYCI